MIKTWAESFAHKLFLRPYETIGAEGLVNGTGAMQSDNSLNGFSSAITERHEFSRGVLPLLDWVGQRNDKGTAEFRLSICG